MIYARFLMVVRHRSPSIAAGFKLWTGVVLLITVLCSASLGAQTLGRLFTTQEERRELDAYRNDPNYGKFAEAEYSGTQGVSTPLPSDVTINGFVRRSKGHHATWVNGARILNGDSTRDGIRLETEALALGTVRLVLPNDPNILALKPGQRLDVLEGQVMESYQLSREVEVESTPMRGGYSALNWLNQNDGELSDVTPID